MAWVHLLSCFVGGAFLANAVPHVVSGTMGRPFQSPFATPPGEGLSPPTTNVLWGFLNLAVAYVLLCRVGRLASDDTAGILALAGGALLLALLVARHFGRFNGGSRPDDP